MIGAFAALEEILIIEEILILAPLLGLTVGTAAIAYELYSKYTAKQELLSKTESQVVAKSKEKANKRAIEIHPSWESLPKRGCCKITKTGLLTTEGNIYLYQKDYTHGDTEVWDFKGKHMGSCPRLGGPLCKPPVYGRRHTCSS